MHRHLTLVLATLALSAAAFAQSDFYYQLGYAANLNIGDSVINLSNDGFRAGFYNNGSKGNICANVFVFDPSEEEISCCSCLITPNGLNSLSAKSDLINNTLTPAIPNSIVVKITSTVPGTTSTGAYTVCNPTIGEGTTLRQPGDNGVYDLTNGLLVWGATLEPNGSNGTYASVAVPFLAGNLNLAGGTGSAAPAGSELANLTSVCNFVQQEGSNFGVCTSCALGALSGQKN